jgi:SulP family sulfate permease
MYAVEAGMILVALLFISRVAATTTVSQVTDDYIEDGRMHILQDKTSLATPPSSASSKRILILCGARERPAQLIHQGEFAEVVGPENICENVQEALRRAEEVYERLEAKFVVGKS